jgi:hypothetical protein
MYQRNLWLLFIPILVSMIIVTSWASSVQPMWEWTGLRQSPNHAWTIATMFDTYFGFITFYTWIVYKESRWLARVLWFIAIMLLGNMAMSVYVMKELWKLRAEQAQSSDPIAILLTRKN